MKHPGVRLGLLALMLAGAGLAQKVQFNFDEAADFSAYKTYRWVDIDEGEQIDEITDRQIRVALDTELATKGLTKTESEDANLYIGYQVALSSERGFTSYSSDWGYGPGWGRRGWGGGGGFGGGMTTGQTSTIPVGTIDLDIYDAKAKRLVWRGIASKTLNPTSNPKKREKRHSKGGRRLLDFGDGARGSSGTGRPGTRANTICHYRTK